MQEWAEKVAAKMRADKAYYQEALQGMIVAGGSRDAPGVVQMRSIIAEIDKALAIAERTY